MNCGEGREEEGREGGGREGGRWEREGKENNYQVNENDSDY